MIEVKRTEVIQPRVEVGIAGEQVFACTLFVELSDGIYTEMDVESIKPISDWEK
jgi:hypothetical protein